MGTGTSNSKSKDMSACLDEDVFGKISNHQPKTSVPIEIKPRRALNGGKKRVSLRGDSVNRSSSFFSNMSSNKNGSFVSYMSINRSEYKKQNEKLRHELNEMKGKMSSQIQTLLSSNVSLKHQNIKLQSEISQVKSSKTKIQRELVSALDNQLALKENVHLYQHKVKELRNVITVKTNKTVPDASNGAVTNQIMSTFLEFILSHSSKSVTFELIDFLGSTAVRRCRTGIVVCGNEEKTKTTENIIDQMLLIFSQLISNFIITDFVCISDNLSDLQDCESIIGVDYSDCDCLYTSLCKSTVPVSLLRIMPVRKGVPPIEKTSKYFTKYNISELSLNLGLQMFILDYWSCDMQVLSPLVFDYSYFFSNLKIFLLSDDLENLNVLPHEDSLDEFEFYVKNVKKSLFVSCSTSDALLFSRWLHRWYHEELLIFVDIEATTTYDDLNQALLRYASFKIGLDWKYVCSELEKDSLK